MLAGLVVEDLEDDAPRKKKKKKKPKGAKGGGVKEGEVSEEVALQVDLTKAKLAAMEFEEKEAAKKRGKQERKARKVSQRHSTHCFSAVLRPFCAVFPPFLCAARLPGAETERTGQKWRKMGEIWGRNGRETAVAEWRWTQAAPATTSPWPTPS